MWDWTILSESLSLSLLVLFIANWLWLVREWKWYKAALIAIIGFFWMFARDSNPYTILMIAVLLALVGFTWRAQRRYLILAAIFVMFFIAYSVSLNEGERWVRQTMNVVGQKVLPDSDTTAYFAEHGMPITPALMERSGKTFWDDNSAFKNDPELQEFRDWLYENGQSTYIQFLLSRPLWTATEPFQYQNREQLVKLNPGNYAPAGFSHILRSSDQNITFIQEINSVPVAQIVYPKKLVFFTVPFEFLGWGILALTLVITLLMALRKLWVGRVRSILTVAGTALKQRNATWVIPIALIVLAYPHVIVVFHGDPNGLNRHAVQAVVQWVVGFWMLLLFAIDIITSAHRSGHRHHVPAVPGPRHGRGRLRRVWGHRR